jgi:hypothetical protein
MRMTASTGKTRQTYEFMKTRRKRFEVRTLACHQFKERRSDHLWPSIQKEGSRDAFASPPAPA